MIIIKCGGANDCGETCCRRCGNDCANVAGICCQSPCAVPFVLFPPEVSGCTTSEECCLPAPGGTCTLQPPQLSCTDYVGGTCCSADSCPFPAGISTDCDDVGQSCCLPGIGGQACGSECEVFHGGTCCSGFCSSDTIHVSGATVCPAGETCCNTATGGKCKSCARECETDEGGTGCSYVMPIAPPPPNMLRQIVEEVLAAWMMAAFISANQFRVLFLTTHQSSNKAKAVEGKL